MSALASYFFWFGRLLLYDNLPSIIWSNQASIRRKHNLKQKRAFCLAHTRDLKNPNPNIWVNTTLALGVSKVVLSDYFISDFLMMILIIFFALCTMQKEQNHETEHESAQHNIMSTTNWLCCPQRILLAMTLPFQKLWTKPLRVPCVEERREQLPWVRSWHLWCGYVQRWVFHEQVKNATDKGHFTAAHDQTWLVPVQIMVIVCIVRFSWHFFPYTCVAMLLLC